LARAFTFLGWRLRGDAVSLIGLIVTAVGISWIFFAAPCYYDRVDHLGLQRSFIVLGSYIGALIASVGQLFRQQ